MKVKILKNKRVVDSENNFTYVIECFKDDEIVYKTIVKLKSTEYMTPDESLFDIRSILDQLSYSVQFDIDSVVYEEIDI